MHPDLGRFPLPAARRPQKLNCTCFYGQRAAGSGQRFFISRQILNTPPKFRADQTQL